MTTANVNIKKVLLRRGNTTQNNNYTGVFGEVTVDTEAKTLRIHDGTTVGGTTVSGAGGGGSGTDDVLRANVGAYQVYANANAAAQTTSINSINANIGAYQIWSNANAAAQTTSINGINANVGAYQTYANANASSQTTEINSLRSNITAANTRIANLLAIGSNVLPAANVTYSLGSANFQWRDLWVSNNTIYIGNVPLRVSSNTLLVNGQQIALASDLVAANVTINTLQTQTYSNVNAAAYLAGNVTAGNLTVSRDAVVLGNLRVQGTQTTVNAATLSVNDLYVTVANGAAQSSDANGAGLRVAGALANIAYSSVSDSFEFNKTITVDNVNFANGVNILSTVTVANLTLGANVVSLGIDGNLLLPNNMNFSSSPAVSRTGIIFGDSTYQRTAYTGPGPVLVNGTHNAALDTAGNLTVPGSILPSTDIAFDLGSPTMRFRHLYVGPGTVYVGNAAIKTTTSGNLILPGVTRPVASSSFVEEVESEGDQSYSFATTPTIIDNAHFSFLNGNADGLSFTPATYSTTGIDGQGYIRNITVDTAGSGYSDRVAELAEQDMWATEAADPINNFVAGDWTQIPFRAETRAGESEYEFDTSNGTDRLTNNGYEMVLDSNGDLTLPGAIIIDGGDGSITPDGDDLVISWDNESLILKSVSDHVEVEADSDFKISVRNDGNDYTGKWVFTQDNELVNISTNTGIVSEGGELRLQGGRDTLSSANVKIVSVNDGVAIHNWTFATTGNVVFPDGTEQSTAYTGGGGGGGNVDLGNLSINGSTIQSETSGNFVNLDVDGENGMRFGTYGSDKVQLFTDWENNPTIWEFYANGKLTAPGDIVVGGPGGGHFVIDGTDGDNTSVRWYNMPAGSDHSIIRTFTGNTDQGTDLNRGLVQLAWQDNDRSGLRIRSYDRSNEQEAVTHDWTFQGNGVLALPPGGDIVNSNGVSVLGGNTSSTTNQLVNNEYTVALQSNGAVTIPGTIISGVTDPTAYRGFYAAVNQISEQGGGLEDDPSLNQIILSRSANMRGYNLSDDTNDDTFFANGITGSSHVAVINLYGEDTSNPLDLDDIKIFVQTYIDLVLYDGTTLRTDVADIQTAFAAAQTDLVDSLPANALRSDFKFNEIQAVINTAGMTTSGSGSGFVYYYNTDTANYSGSDETDILVAGTGYQINDTITVPGTALGGIAPADNMTITVAGIDGSGGITSIDRSGSMDSTRFANLFVKHFIIEGYDDAYDQGNGIGTDRSECVFIATANTATERITVSAVTSGELAPFQAFSQNNDYNYMILHQVSGTAGGAGVYVTGGYDTIDDEATATTYTANGIYYGINDPQYDSPAFGGGDYVSMVNTEVGIFTMVAVNADIDRVSYIGETGADSDGIKILTASFDIGTGVNEYPGIELTVGTNTWTFENTGNLTLPQTSNVGITFSDGTFQKTAYKRPDNLMLDGGGAATIYEVTVDYAEGGFSATRYGVNTPSFDGSGAELDEPVYYTLDGGGA